MKTNFLFYLFATGLFAIACKSNNKGDNVSINSQPNILLIVADDLGYADLGCFGGDIQTPNIDALARRGTIFSRFHTAPMCAPTRAMLLSGNDNHIAGMGNQYYKGGEYGYEGYLSDRIVPVPALLKEAGYRTNIVGKWHLGSDSIHNPAVKGFDQSFVNLGGAGSHYHGTGFSRGWPKSRYTENGEPVEWPEDAYTTDYFTDKLIAYMDQGKEEGTPFFTFAAYTSPHWPLQVEEKFWKKYEGRYDDGYEALKEKRLKSLQKAGMIPDNATLPPNEENVKPWDSLTKEEQKREARKMELYAGMVDNLDYNVGRLINYLKESDQFENTIIIFMSDNGAAAEDFYNGSGFMEFVRATYNNDYENMGSGTSFVSYGPQWAEAGSSPFRYFKGYTTEGGMIAPMMISGPGISRVGEISHEFATLVDLAPTFYELAGVEYPENFDNKPVHPLKGSSLWSFLNKKSEFVHDENYVFALEHNNIEMVRKGDWKLLNLSKPFDEHAFELYNVKEDLAELNDLKDEQPQIYSELLEEWRKYAEEVQVIYNAAAGD